MNTSANCKSTSIHSDFGKTTPHVSLNVDELDNYYFSRASTVPPKDNEIVLIRGLPGSGKSTMAKSMKGYKHFEADMFLEVNGEYAFDASKVKAAHDWCVASAKKALEHGKNVVVSNTFVKLWELQRYIDLGFNFRVIESQGGWSNIHGVPDDKVKKMENEWQELPVKWHEATEHYLILALERALGKHTEYIGEYAVEGTGWPWHVLLQKETIAEITARMHGCTDEQRAKVPAILKKIARWYDDCVVMLEKNSEFLPEAAEILQNWFIKGELPD